MGGIVKAVLSPIAGLMGGASDPGSPSPPPAAPSDDAGVAAARVVAAEEQRKRQAAGGRASNILTSPLGDTGAVGVSARKTLLGM